MSILNLKHIKKLKKGSNFDYHNSIQIAQNIEDDFDDLIPTYPPIVKVVALLTRFGWLKNIYHSSSGRIVPSNLFSWSNTLRKTCDKIRSFIFR